MDSEIPSQYICPITLEIMKDPVICSDGFTYERTTILTLPDNISPMTRQEINKESLIPNIALKQLIEEYNEKKKELKFVFISNPTHQYNNYLFDINKKDEELIIKIQNKKTQHIYKGNIISGENNSIKSITIFYKMLLCALSLENNYTITFNETNNNMIVSVLFNNDVIIAEERFILNEIIISETNKQNYKIMSLEHESKMLKDEIKTFKDELKNIKDEIKEIKNKNDLEILKTRVIKIEEKQLFFNNIIKWLYWISSVPIHISNSLNPPNNTLVKIFLLQTRQDLEMIPSLASKIELYFPNVFNLYNIVDENIIYNDIKYIKLNFYKLSYSYKINSSEEHHDATCITHNKKKYYSELGTMIQIIKKHFVNAEIECHGRNSYFENIDYFLCKSKDQNSSRGVYLIK